MCTFGNALVNMSDKYFIKPSKFDPERWDRDDIHPYCNLVFGFGARMCIGKRLAEQEIYLTTIKLLQNYRLEYSGQVKIKTGLFCLPDTPLNLTFIKRN
jgi:cytochrome P450